MKNILRILAVIIALTTIGLTGCDGENNTGGTFESISIQDISPEEFYKWKDADIDKVYSIHDAEQLTHYLTEEGNPLPEIDFEKHTLLLAYGYAPSSILGVSKVYYFNEKSGHYTLRVTVEMHHITGVDRWSLAVLVPVIPDTIEVKEEIYFFY